MKKIYLSLLFLAFGLVTQAQWGGVGHKQYWQGVTPIIINSYPNLALVNTDQNVDQQTYGNLTFGLTVNTNNTWQGESQVRYNFMDEKFELRHFEDSGNLSNAIFSFYVNKTDIDSGGRGLFNIGIENNARLALDPNEIQAFSVADSVGVLSLNPDGGFVGVGTHSPKEKLHIENGRVVVEAETSSGMGPLSLSTGYDLYHGNTRKGALTYFEPVIAGFNTHEIALNAYQGGMLKFRTDNATRMVIRKNGFVGINTATPQHTLDVNGDGYFSGELTALSDLKVKRDITPITDAIDMINKIRPVSYEFKNDEFPELNLSKRKRWGVIAQEIEQVFPELISENGKTSDITGQELSLKSVNYIDMIPMLIKAVQEQNELIRSQEQRIRELENK